MARSEAVEAQAVRAFTRGVVEEPAQVAGLHFGGSRALRLAVPAAAASEATQGGELEVVVEVARHAKQATHLVVLALVLAGALWRRLAIGPGRGRRARRVENGRLRVRRPVERDRRVRTRGGRRAPRRLVEDERLVRVVGPGGVTIVRPRRRRRRLRRGRPRPRAFLRHGARRCGRRAVWARVARAIFWHPRVRRRQTTTMPATRLGNSISRTSVHLVVFPRRLWRGSRTARRAGSTTRRARVFTSARTMEAPSAGAARDGGLKLGLRQFAVLVHRQVLVKRRAPSRRWSR